MDTYLLWLCIILIAFAAVAVVSMCVLSSRITRSEEDDDCDIYCAGCKWTIGGTAVVTKECKK